MCNFLRLFFIFSLLVSVTSVAGIRIYYASPDDGSGPADPDYGRRDECGPEISAEIEGAESVHMTMYTFTFEALKRKLEQIARDGKKVCILVDQQQYKTANGMQDLVNDLAALLNVKIRMLGKNMPGGEMMHEKSVITRNVDGKHTLILGSYNWTRSASTKHFENCLFLKEDSVPDVIAQAKTRFDELWRKSLPLVGTREVLSDSDCLMAPDQREKGYLEALAAAQMEVRSRLRPQASGRTSRNQVFPSSTGVNPTAGAVGDSAVSGGRGPSTTSLSSDKPRPKSLKLLRRGGPSTPIVSRREDEVDMIPQGVSSVGVGDVKVSTPGKAPSLGSQPKPYTAYPSPRRPPKLE